VTLDLESVLLDMAAGFEVPAGELDAAIAELRGRFWPMLAELLEASIDVE
jgi:hypothetical protein